MTAFDQVCFSSSQIALFFDKKNHQKGSTDIFTFLHGDNHQEKVACEGVTFGLVWPMGFQDFWLSISLDGINWYLCLTVVIFFFFFIHSVVFLLNLVEVYLLMKYFITFISLWFNELWSLQCLNINCLLSIFSILICSD